MAREPSAGDATRSAGLFSWREGGRWTHQMRPRPAGTNSATCRRRARSSGPRGARRAMRIRTASRGGTGPAGLRGGVAGSAGALWQATGAQDALVRGCGSRRKRAELDDGSAASSGMSAPRAGSARGCADASWNACTGRQDAHVLALHGGCDEVVRATSALSGEAARGATREPQELARRTRSCTLSAGFVLSHLLAQSQTLGALVKRGLQSER